MKEEKLYPIYLIYLESRLNEGQINRGSWSLLKISRIQFEEFKNKFEIDELFRKKIIKIWTSENRNQKIDDILKDETN